MQVNGERLIKHLKQIGSIGVHPDGGHCRFSWTPAYKQACVELTELMESIGMKVHMDAVGNLYGRMEGSDPSLKPILTGSHLDTKPYGGLYDGNTGIQAGLEALFAMHDAGFKPRRSIDLVCFINEEASEFLGGCFGSRAITGQIDSGYFKRCVDRHTGQTMYDAMKEFGMGCDPDHYETCILKPDQYYCFIETHIEQGRHLLDDNKSISILDGIAGIKEFYITIKGERAHAGGMAMSDRHDAMAAAVNIAAEVERLAINGGVASRGTCAYITSFPAEISIISDTATVAVDFREIDGDIFESLERDLIAYTEEQCKKRGLTYSVKMDLNARPAICNKTLKEIMQGYADARNIPNEPMVSYPAHDAHHLSRLYPMAMIFLRSSNGGVSHCPEEYTLDEDEINGAQVLLDTLEKLSMEDIAL